MEQLTKQELEQTYAGSIIDEIATGVKILISGAIVIKGFFAHTGELKGPGGVDVKFGNKAATTNVTQVVFPHIYVD